MDLIRLSVLPSACGADQIAKLVIASPATRIVKSYAASPWEVFLCPEQAQRFSIHYHRPEHHHNNGRR
jgi:hypothetical protein